MCKLKSVSTNFNTKIDVAEIKTEYIKNIINSAAKCSHIQQIILFGSAVSSRCTETSDIDIAIISNKSVSGLNALKSFRIFMNSLYDFDESQEYDRLYFKSIDDIKKKSEKIQICREIADRGKVIYRKATV